MIRQSFSENLKWVRDIQEGPKFIYIQTCEQRFIIQVVVHQNYKFVCHF